MGRPLRRPPDPRPPARLTAHQGPTPRHERHDPRRHHHRPLLASTSTASRSAARLEDMASFAKSVGGCPTNIAIGAARLGLKTGAASPASATSRWAASSASSWSARASTTGGHRRPTRAADRAGDPRHPRREDVPADLLPRELRRHGARRGRHRRGLHRLGRARSSSPARISRTPNRGAAQRKAIAARQGARRQGRVRHRLPAVSGAWPATARRGALRQLRRASPRHLQTRPAGLRPDRRHRGGDPHRRRDDRHARRPAADPRARPSALHRAASAAPMGCVVFPGAIPDDLEDGIVGPGFPVEVYNVLGAGDAFMSGFLRGWLRDEPLERPARLGQCLRRLRGLAPWLRAGHTRPGPSCSTSSSTAARAGRCARTPALKHIHWATTRRRAVAELMALAIDHRTQLEALADEAGADARAPARLQAAGGARRRCRSPAAGRTSACCSTAATAGTRCADGRAASGCVDRPADRAAGLPAAALRQRAVDRGRRLRDWPVDHVRQVPVLLPSGRRAGLARRSRSGSCAACSTPAARPATSCCWRSSRPAGGPPADAPRCRARWSGFYDARRQARLVEARPRPRRGRVARHRRGDRAPRPASAAASCCSG